MTDEERCDKCEFYQVPPKSDEKGVENRVLQLTYGPPKATPPGQCKPRHLSRCAALQQTWW